MNLQTVTGGEPQSRIEPITTKSDLAKQVLKVISDQNPSNAMIKNVSEKDETKMDHLLDQAEKMANVFGRNLKFRYRKEADVYQVEVIDAQSNEIVRKIPSDEMVRFIEHINEMLGALFDTQA